MTKIFVNNDGIRIGYRPSTYVEMKPSRWQIRAMNYYTAKKHKDDIRLYKYWLRCEMSPKTKKHVRASLRQAETALQACEPVEPLCMGLGYSFAPNPVVEDEVTSRYSRSEEEIAAIREVRYNALKGVGWKVEDDDE